MGGYSRRAMVKILTAATGYVYGAKNADGPNQMPNRPALVLVIPPEGIVIQAGAMREQITIPMIQDALRYKTEEPIVEHRGNLTITHPIYIDITKGGSQ